MAEREMRYSNLRDYLALLRRQKLVVIAVTLVFGGAALALSVTQEKSYETQASVQFNDIDREIALLGTLELPADTNPLVNAAVKAEEVTSLDTARRVKRDLEVEISADSLQDAISTRVGSQTIFVEVTAAWDDPDFAARLANGFARAAVEAENRQLERQLKTTIAELEPRAQGPLVDDGGNLDVDRFNARNQLGSLETLEQQVDNGIITPAQVARRAEVPTGASSPRTARNTILGVIVGLALGLLAGFARDVLDRRIRSSSDAHERFGLPVLGRVGDSALGGTGAARSANGRVTAAPDIEAFRILRTNLAALNPDQPARSVLVTSAVAQEGKSTVAASLAAASAAAGQRTLLVEGDLRRPVLAKRLDFPPTPGLSEYLADNAQPKEILNTVPVTPSGGSNGERSEERTLVCIPAGNPHGEPAELLATERCRDFLAKVSRAYDLVVIDSSPILATADPLELIPHVDSVLICVRLTSSTTDQARGVGEALDLMPERPSGLVVTGAGSADGYYGYYGY